MVSYYVVNNVFIFYNINILCFASFLFISCHCETFKCSTSNLKQICIITFRCVSASRTLIYLSIGCWKITIFIDFSFGSYANATSQPLSVLVSMSCRPYITGSPAGLTVLMASAVVVLKHETSTLRQRHNFILIDFEFGVDDYVREVTRPDKVGSGPMSGRDTT